MSYKIEIADSTSHKIEISSSVNDQTPTVQILEGYSSDINISHDIALLPADFNDNVKIIIDNFLAAGYGVSIVPSGSFLRISTSGLQPSGDYSLVGHSHVSSDIINFNSSVSGLLPVKNIIAGSGIKVEDLNGIFNVAVTGQFGLTSEQVDDRVSSLLSSGYGINLNYDDNNNLLTISTIGLQPSGNYSVVGHSHVAADISDFVSAASGSAPVQTVAGRAGNILLTKNDVGLNNVDNTSDTNKPISSATQNALNLKSDIGHLHTSSNITDFSSSVSGLLPVKNILSGSGISVTSSGSDFTVAVTGQFGLTGEQVDDRISNLLVAGNYVNLNYNDSADILTVSVTGVQPSGNYSITGHSHVISDVSGLQNALDSKQPSGNYANFVHVHTSSDITDFNSSVSGLLPVKNIIGSGYVNISSSSGNFTVSVNGLQPSGNYANSAHTHTSSQITDFNTSVSGLLTPYATINNPNFSGIPTAPTATSGTNNSQIANTQFVRTEISNLVNSAPSTLDTLNELATALGNDPNFATTITNNLAGKANLTGATFSGPISGPSGDFGVLKQSGVVVSVSGHTHSYTDITNFASGVSDNLTTALLAGSFINLDYNSSQDTLTISASGLQPSGNYSLVGHTHTSSDITDFNSSVSELLPVKNVLGSGYITSSSSSGVVTIAVTGLQPSGNYSTVGHTHASSSITDFNTSVSGLIPISDITSSSGIIVNKNGTTYNISSSGLAYLSGASFAGAVSATSGSFNNIKLNIGDINNPGISFNDAAFKIYTGPYSGFTISSDGSKASFEVTDPGIICREPLYPFSGLFLRKGSSTQPSIAGEQDNSTGFNFIGDTFGNQGIIDCYSVGVRSFRVSSGGQFSVGTSVPSGVFHASGISNFTGSVFINTVPVSVSGHSHNISSINNLQSVLDDKASLNSPTFTGTPTVPTANSGTNSTQIASTAFVRNEISNLVASAPSVLDTLNELATALGNDANFSTTVTNNLAGKANLSGAIFTGLVSGPSGDFTSLRQNGAVVSVSGHTHTSSNITDFNSSVSGLINVKDIISGPNIDITNNNGLFTISSNVSNNLTRGSFLLNETADTFNVVNGYNVGSLDIFLNGVKLSSNGDYIASNGTSFTLTSPAPSGSVIEYLAMIPGHNFTGTDLLVFNNSPTFTGIPTVPTAAGGTNTNQIASTSFVRTEINNIQASNISDFNSSVSGLLPAHNNIIIHSNISDINALNISGVNYIYIFNSGAENSSLILPTALNNQNTYTLKNNTNGNIYYKTSNSQTIDSYSPSPMPSGTVIGLNIKYSSITVVSDGNNWIIT